MQLLAIICTKYAIEIRICNTKYQREYREYCRFAEKIAKPYRFFSILFEFSSILFDHKNIEIIIIGRSMPKRIGISCRARSDWRWPKSTFSQMSIAKCKCELHIDLKLQPKGILCFFYVSRFIQVRVMLACTSNAKELPGMFV